MFRGLGLNFNFFIVFPAGLELYIGNFVLGWLFAEVILGGTKGSNRKEVLK